MGIAFLVNPFGRDRHKKFYVSSKKRFGFKINGTGRSSFDQGGFADKSLGL